MSKILSYNLKFLDTYRSKKSEKQKAISFPDRLVLKSQQS